MSEPFDFDAAVGRWQQRIAEWGPPAQPRTPPTRPPFQQPVVQQPITPPPGQYGWRTPAGVMGGGVVLPPQAGEIESPWWLPVQSTPPRTPWSPPVDRDPFPGPTEGLYYQLTGEPTPEWITNLREGVGTASQYADYLLHQAGQRISQAWQSPATRYKTRMPIGPPEPTLGEQYWAKGQELEGLPWAERIPGALGGAAELLSSAGRQAEDWWREFVEREAPGLAQQSYQFQEQVPNIPPLHALNQLTSAGLQTIGELGVIPQALWGGAVVAGHPEAEGMGVEEWAPLGSIGASLGWEQFKERDIFAPGGGILDRQSVVGEALREIKAGRDPYEVAYEHQDPIVQLVVEAATDPLNLFDWWQVGNKLARGKALTAAEMRMATAVDDAPEMMNLLGRWHDEVGGLTRQGADALETAARAAGETDQPGFWQKLKRLNPFELTPAAKAERDTGEMWIVLSGPLSDARSGDEAMDLLARWAADPDALAARYGEMARSMPGRKTGTILSNILDDAAQLPSAQAPAGEFNPARFVVELEELALGALKDAYGYKEPNRYLRFANAWKGLMSEFYLSAAFAPGYVARNTASDLFTAATDGLTSFEKMDDVDAYLDVLGPLTTRRITTGGKGAREALTGIKEGKSRFPGPFGRFSEWSQQITRQGEVGRLPIGEEPRYKRAYYKAAKQFFDENVLRRTPAPPPEVYAMYGGSADSLLHDVAHSMNVQEKRAAVERFLSANSPGQALSPYRYLDAVALDSFSPEMARRVRQGMDALPPEAGPADIQALFNRLRGLIDEDEALRLADTESLPVRRTASDTEAEEIVEAVVEELGEIARRSGDPDLIARADDLARRAPEIEAAVVDARRAAVDVSKAQPTDDALEIMLATYEDINKIVNDNRARLGKRMAEVRSAYQQNPAHGDRLWPPYFDEVAHGWEEAANARIDRYAEAQRQLQRLQGGEPVESILGRTRQQRAEDRLLAASEIIPEAPEGYVPGSVMDAEESAKFDQFLASQRGRQDNAQTRAWRAAFGSEPEQYGDVLDLLDSAASDVELYGKRAAGKVGRARRAAFDQAAKIKAKGGKNWGARVKLVFEKYYAIRNDTYREFFDAAEQRWKIAERDVMMQSYHPGPRMEPPLPEQPEQVRPRPGDEELVRQALAKQPVARTPDELAAIDRWTATKRALPSPVPTEQAPLEVPERYTREQFSQDLRDVFKLSDDEAKAVQAITDARARVWSSQTGRHPSEWYTQRLAGMFPAGEGQLAQSLFQRAPELPAFQRWFRDSKVVDEAGQPMVVYHGTASPRQFREFSTEGMPMVEDEWGFAEPLVSYSGSPDTYIGAHFAEEPEVASGFAMPEAATADWQRTRHAEGPGRVYPVYLSIQNPITFEREADWTRFMLDRDMGSYQDMEWWGREWAYENDLPEDEFWTRYDADPEFRIEQNEALLTRPTEDDMGMQSPVNEWFAEEIAWSLKRQLREMGHDGVRYKNDVEGGTSWIAFEPEQIKSPFNVGEFDPSSPDILYQDAPRWYYKAEQVIDAKMPNRAPIQQVRAILTKGGIKKDELEWSGVLDWLSEQKGKVSKQEVLGYLQENQVRVEEVVKGQPAQDWQRLEAERDQLLSQANDLRFEMMDVQMDPEAWGISDVAEYERITQAEIDNLERQLAALPSMPDVTETKYASYTLPGGERYRELLLTLPPKPPSPEDYARAEAAAKRYAEMDAHHGRLFDAAEQKYGKDELYKMIQEDRPFPEREELQRVGAEVGRLRDEMQLPVSQPHYKGRHWDEPNVLAHIRFNERQGPDGAKVLFIEEVQSDWHQAGRERGYQTERQQILDRLARQGIRKEEGSAYGFLNEEGKYVAHPNSNMYPHRAVEGTDKQQKLIRRYFALDKAVPGAPFAKSWDELALKRMLGWAAENDFDRIAWTTGAQQADRYSLAKVVDELEWFQEYNGEWTLQGYKDGQQVFREVATADQLPDYVGKEVANRLIETQQASAEPGVTGSGVGSVVGDDLQVGGQGMATFYDRILPYSMRKVGKRYGLQVGPGQVDVGAGLPEGWYISGDPSSGFRVHAPDDRLWHGGFATYEDAASAMPDMGRDYADVHTVDLTPRAKQQILAEGQALFQAKKGSIQFMEDGRAIVGAFEQADVSTVVHEVGHIFRRELEGQELADIERWAGADGGNWTREAEEKWARAFERYLAEGAAPTPELAGVFERFKQWLVGIYRAIRGSDIDVALDDNVRGVFDRLLAEVPEPRAGDVYGQELAMQRQMRAGEAQRAAVQRLPLSLDDAAEVYGTGADWPALGKALEADYTKAYQRSTVKDLRALADQMAHRRLATPKTIEVGGKSLKISRERTMTAKQQDDLYFELQGIPTGATRAEKIKLGKAFREKQAELANWYMDLMSDAEARAAGQQTPVRTPPEWLARESLEDLEQAGELFQRGRRRAPGQMEMFGAGEDLPLFSGAAQRGQAAEFAPGDVGRREYLPGMEPTYDELAEAEAARKARELEGLRPREVPEGQATLWQHALAPDWSLRDHPWIEEARDIFGLTWDTREAGFLLPDGEMLDFTGKMEGGTPGVRAYDHRDIWRALEAAGADEAGGTEGMLAFMDRTGAVRMSDYGDDIIIDVAAPLTHQQQRMIRSWAEYREIVWDITDPKSGEVLASGQTFGGDRIEEMFRAAKEAENQGILYQTAGQASDAKRAAYNTEMAQKGAGEAPAYADMVQAQAQATRQGLDQIEAGVLRDWDTWQPQVADEGTRQAVMDWLENDVTPAWYDTRATGLSYAKTRADDALLNYRNRRNFDVWLSYVAPYSYWFTRSGANWAKRLATRPGMLSNYIRARDAMKLSNENAGRRQRFEEKLAIPFPWLPEWMGDNIYVDPLKFVLPFANFGGTNWDDPDEARTGLQRLNSTIQTLGIRPYHFLEYPLKMAMAAERGMPADFGYFLPHTRLLSGLTAGTELGGPGGVNLEAPVRRLLGLPTGETWDPYRTGRMLGNLAAEDPSNPQLARSALIAMELLHRDPMQREKLWEPGNPLAQQVAAEMNWQPVELQAAQELLAMAMTRAAQERLVATLGSFAGPGAAVETRGERAQLEMAELGRRQIYRPDQQLGGREAYQAYKDRYPAMYPRAAQYTLLPGEEPGKTMGAGARANWLALRTEKARINAQYDAQVDAHLRARPWDWKGKKSLENQRYQELDRAKARYPVPEMTGDLPAILYGMNPAEMWDSVIEDALWDIKAEEPDPDTFTDAGGDVDWGAYYDARDAWMASLPLEIPGVGQVLGGSYSGMSTAEALHNFDARHYSALEAANRVYQEAIARPAWDAYNASKAAGKKDWSGTVGAVGPVGAEQLIPEILSQYAARGWSEQELMQALAGVIFPPLEDQLDDRGTASIYTEAKAKFGEDILDIQEEYFTHPKGSQARRDFLTQYPQLGRYWDWKRARDGKPATYLDDAEQELLAAGDWRAAVGKPWWEKYPAKPYSRGPSRWLPARRQPRRGSSYTPGGYDYLRPPGQAEGAGSVEQQARTEYRQMMEIIEQQWPGIEELEQAYFALEPGQRRDFLAQHPELRAYWDFKDQWWADHPVGAAFYGKGQDIIPGTGQVLGQYDHLFPPTTGGGFTPTQPARWEPRQTMAGGPQWAY